MPHLFASACVLLAVCTQLLNNAFALLPMGALAYYFGEHHKWAKIRAATASDGVLLFASCINAVGISYSGINAQAYVSATTFMVLSNVNKFVVVAFGMVVLREASSWQAVVGVTMALLGGVWYARARSMAK